MPLVMPGRWGKRNYRYFAKAGSPKGEIVRELQSGIVVMFNCQELLDYTIKQLSTVCEDLGCPKLETCPGNPDCDILHSLFKYQII